MSLHHRFQTIIPKRAVATSLLSTMLGMLCFGTGVAHTMSLPAGEIHNSSSQHASLELQSSATKTTSTALQISVNVSSTPTSDVIPGSILGLSYARSHQLTFFAPSNLGLVALFHQLGSGGVLRLIGDSPNDDTLTDSVVLQNLRGFLDATGWKCIYGLGLKTATASVDAAEAQAVQTYLGPDLLGFEIGNEPDSFSAVGARPATYSIADFEAEWETYRSAILAKTPSAVFYGPVTAAHETTWVKQFALDEHTRIASLDQHFYPRSPDPAPVTSAAQDASIQYLMQHYDQTQSISNLLQSVDPYNLPYRIAETNTVDDSGEKGVSDSDASAIWSLTSLFGAVQGKATGLNFMATADTPYTPIVLSGTGLPQSVRPLYAGALFFKVGAVGGRQVAITTNANANTEIVYAVSQPNNRYSVYVINLSPTDAVDATITLPGAIQGMDTLTMATTGLDSLDPVTIGGSTVGADGSWAPTWGPWMTLGSSHVHTVNVPAHSAVLVHAVLK